MIQNQWCYQCYMSSNLKLRQILTSSMVSSSVISGVSEVLKSDAWRPIIKNDAPDKKKKKNDLSTFTIRGHIIYKTQL